MLLLETDKEKKKMKKNAEETIKKILECHKDALKVALPKSVSLKMFTRAASRIVKEHRELYEKPIQDSPASFIDALYQMAQLGFIADEKNRRAYIVRRRNYETGKYFCRLFITKNGLVDIALRSGDVVDIKVVEVMENDEFEYLLKVGERQKKRECRLVKFRHKVAKIPGGGYPYALYAVVSLKNGVEHFTCLHWEDFISSLRHNPDIYNHYTGMFCDPYRTDIRQCAQRAVLLKCLQEINPETVVKVEPI